MSSRDFTSLSNTSVFLIISRSNVLALFNTRQNLRAYLILPIFFLSLALIRSMVCLQLRILIYLSITYKLFLLLFFGGLRDLMQRSQCGLRMEQKHYTRLSIEDREVISRGLSVVFQKINDIDVPIAKYINHVNAQSQIINSIRLAVSLKIIKQLED